MGNLISTRDRPDVLKNRSILVVNDDIRSIFALTAIFEREGANVEIARNGKEALAKLEKHPRLDLVLMDIAMPEMDGYEATREIRKQGRFAGLPIIALLDEVKQNDQELCMEAGINDWHPHLTDLKQLFSLVRVWMPSLKRTYYLV